jgi:GTP-binding protein
MNGAANKLPNVAIVGRPNVGKSALFNRLIGRRIAIVHDQPGITRDRISAVCTRGTQPFVLWDTGGIAGVGESELSVQVRHAVQEAIRDSDVLLLLVDARQGLSPLDQELARMLRRSHKHVVLVINKIDNPAQENLAADFASLGFQQTQSVSAEHNRGICELLQAINQCLPAATAVQHPVSSTQHPASSTRHSVAIAIIGRPNVGKSSLINSILRSERATASIFRSSEAVKSFSLSTRREFADAANNQAQLKSSASCGRSEAFVAPIFVLSLSILPWA